MSTAALRLLPVPTNEPPYDEHAGSSPGQLPRSTVQAPLPLGFAPARVPAKRSSRAARRQVSTKTQHRIAEDLADLKQWRHTTRAELCDPQPWAVRVARGIAEVIAGARAPRQLSAWFTADALAALIKAAKQQRIRDRVALRVRPPAPLANGRLTTGHRGSSPQWSPRVLVRSVRTIEPSDGACEISVHLRIGERSRALAMRAEGRNGRWVCTALQLG